MLKDQEQLEFAISQYLDGTLLEFDRRVLEDRLAVDAEARLLASEHAHLDAMLKRSRVEPAIDFDKFAAHLSGLIEDESSYVAQPMRMPGNFLRYSSIAAAVVLFIGAGLHFIPWNTLTPEVAAAKLEVTVQVAEKPTAPASINIAVGPTDQLQQSGYAQGVFDDTLIPRSPRLVISAANQPHAGDDRLY